MVVELTFENKSGKVRKVQVLVKQFALVELIGDTKTLIKIIKEVKISDEVLIGIRDLDV